MDSQVTLVNALGPGFLDENIILIFDQDDMKNTTLRIHGTDFPSYVVNTTKNTTTTKSYSLVPNQGIYGAGSKQDYYGVFLSNFTTVVDGFNGEKMIWVISWFVLRELPGSSDDTLAWFSESRRDLGDYVMDAAYLAIKPEMVEMRDTIVLSCLLAEHKRRAMAAEQSTTIFDTMAVGAGF